ncbi:helix-turn-helix domain-containing protein [Halosegnis marinus]|uniref:helix-turn-helix domain-containing protein n=1 Tax=Halosegnis marinus TaxID=3034023 RepID=UPI00361FFFEA
MYPETKLVAKRTLDGPGDEREEPTWSGDVSLTDRQFGALEAAFDAGYFEWPRDATAEEVADELDISAATLHYHLRRAERSLVESFLESRRE